MVAESAKSPPTEQIQRDEPKSDEFSRRSLKRRTRRQKAKSRRHKAAKHCLPPSAFFSAPRHSHSIVLGGLLLMS